MHGSRPAKQEQRRQCTIIIIITLTLNIGANDHQKIPALLRNLGTGVHLTR